MDYCIIYLSSSTKALSAQELNQILVRSQEKNRAQGITGVLLYCDGSIIQVLEGPEEKVKMLYETIEQDERHQQLIRLYSKEIDRRSFEDWSMGYRTLSVAALDTVREMFREPHLSSQEEGIVWKLARLFYQNNLR